LWSPRGSWVARVERARATRILSRAARVVVTSPLTQAGMQQRFPDARFVTITNGLTLDESIIPLRETAPDKCLFRYIGVLNERRKPDPLLEGWAIACRTPGFRNKVHLEFVGGMAGHERSIERLGLGDVVSSRGRVSFEDSLRLMRGSDVNVVLQTIDEGQDVIAGKTFEYLAAGKPVLGVVSEQGGDAWLLRRVGGTHLAGYHDPERIAVAIRACVQDFERGAPGPEREQLRAFDRRRLTGTLAQLMHEVLLETREGTRRPTT
ncbi:MAG TPA: glycosyltransferase, partial [Polyangiaceae bacterium]|nr:glycosyltransferase [Polyangiaceae bacterium]